MSTLLVEAPVASMQVDESRFPDRDDGLILDHLERTCSKGTQLPAVTVVVEGDTATVVRNHKYFEVARRLGRERMRAVVISSPAAIPVERFLARPDVTRLALEEIQRQEAIEASAQCWHVVYFVRPLSSDEQEDFSRRVAGLYAPHDQGVRIGFDDAGPLAEFAARTPSSDDGWMRRHLELFTEFSRERVKIVSLQGRRFAF